MKFFAIIIIFSFLFLSLYCFYFSVFYSIWRWLLLPRKTLCKISHKVDAGLLRMDVVGDDGNNASTKRNVIDRLVVDVCRDSHVQLPFDAFHRTLDMAMRRAVNL